MSEGENDRLIAWKRELVTAHRRLHEMLDAARDAVDAGSAASARADIALYCQGFCAALTGHHAREDVTLFPELSARYPLLRPTIAKLEQDHAMIVLLLTQFDQALASLAAPSELSLHLDGLSAIMESHFRYEERQLLDALAEP